MQESEAPIPHLHVMDTVQNEPEVPEQVPDMHNDICVQVRPQVEDRASECYLVLPHKKPSKANKNIQCTAPLRKSQGVQVGIKMVDKGTSCRLLLPPSDSDEETYSDHESNEEDGSDEKDPLYDPLMDSDESSSDEKDYEDEVVDEDLCENDERSFIVAASCLRALLAFCVVCSSACRVILCCRKGTAITLEQICPNNLRQTFSSLVAVQSKP